MNISTKSVIPFEELPPEQRSQAGGKGGTLAKLYQAGYPVPAGFMITPAAFDGEDLKPKTWAAVKSGLDALRTKGDRPAFAVRSSALSEDSATASFAGELETVLNLRGDEEIRAAIRTVRGSGASARVRAYSQAKGMGARQQVAVIVQVMADAEFSGVLFTADPVTGSRRKMTGVMAVGLGDQLVSGSVDGIPFEFQRPKGRYQGPDDLNKFSRKLYRLALRLEKDLDGPQDIEWAAAGGRVVLLQSRPITTLNGRNPATGAWNDTFSGDYLWSNVNFGEAVTEAMTPLAWSVLEFTLEDWVFLPGFATTGNIAGSPYLNISIFATLFKALGRSREDLLRYMEGTLYMELPEEMEIPLIPTTPRMLAGALGSLFRVQINQRLGVRRLPAYLADNPDWFRRMRAAIRQVSSGNDLVDLWRGEIAPHVRQGVWTVLGTANNASDYTMALRRKLTRLVGPEDASILIANLSAEDDLLPSLGPVAGLARVAAGEMGRDQYLEAYGHRGPHEFEISKPRPVEDPGWLDRQLDGFRAYPVQVDELITEQRVSFEAAWARFQTRCPRKAGRFGRRLAENARRGRLREEARSAYVRDRWLIRLYALRTGEILGIGEDVFYLYLDEVQAALMGDTAALAYVPARKATHQSYLELPVLPSIIRGRFDPFQWAADPNRREDIYDAQAPIPKAPVRGKTGAITGSPGSAGRVEGTVRVLKNAGEGGQLRKGEILVTTQTDISWTVLFPRAAAVITDVGAPLSHASIVARELGIPAVVGCGDATLRLKTGDRVRVDGGQGLVELVSS